MEFTKGERVELHPATDLWMMGARYATIERVGKKWVYIRSDANHHKVYKVSPDLITKLERN